MLDLISKPLRSHRPPRRQEHISKPAGMEAPLSWAPHPKKVSDPAEYGPLDHSDTRRTSTGQEESWGMEVEDPRLLVMIQHLGRMRSVCQSTMGPNKGWWGLSLEMLGGAGDQGEEATFGIGILLICKSYMQKYCFSCRY